MRSSTVAKALRWSVLLVIAPAWLLGAPAAAQAANAAGHLHPAVKLLKPKPTLLGDTVTAQVRLSPAVQGVIQVQQRTAGHWKKLHQAQIGRRHTVRVPIRESVPGVATYRVIVRAAGYRPSTGRPLRVRVAGTGVRAKPRKRTVALAPGQVSQMSGSPSGTETIKLAANAHAPVKGDILAVPATQSSSGVLGLVQKVVASGGGTHTVTTTPAALDQAYSSFSAAVTGDLGSVAVPVPASAHSARRPASFPVTCTGSAGETITPTLDLSKMHVQFSLTATPPSIHFLLAGQPSLGLTLKGNASFSCSLDDSVKLTILVPGTPLVVTIQPRIDISANAEVNVTLTWQPRLAIAFDRAPGLSQNIYALNGSATSISASLAAHADGWFAGELGVSLAGRVGVSGSFGPDITADATTSGGTPCVDVERALKAQLEAFADAFFKHWSFTLASGTFDKATLYKNCQSGGGGGGGNPSITTTSLTAATVGDAYSQTLQATGGAPPYTWSISSGSLPAGLVFSSNGAITGTPTTAGTSYFTVRVSDSAGAHAEQALALLVVPTGGGPIQAIEAPLPANAGASQGVNLFSVSCASAGNCTAVGSYIDSAGHSQGLLLNETNGTWQTGTEASLPGDAATNQGALVTSVSCSSAGNCSAVGEYYNSSGLQALLLDETNGSWGTGIKASLPGVTEGLWQWANPSVSCSSAGNCSVAATFYACSPGCHATGLLLDETNGTWGNGVEVSVPPPTDGASDWSVFLSSVSCTSSGNCSAVGTYEDTFGGLLYKEVPILFDETNGTWATGIEASLPANSVTNPEQSQSESVSCGSAGNCSAVGSYVPNSLSGGGLLLNETDGAWATGIEAPLPSNDTGGARVLSVSCTSPGDCSAVGYFVVAGQAQGLMLDEVGGSWLPGAEASLPADAGSNPQAFLHSVSCVSGGNCSAVGYYEITPNTSFQGLLLNETGGGWEPGIKTPLPTNAAPVQLSNNGLGFSAVSCGAQRDCSAVGTYTDTSGNMQGLIVTETP